MQTIHHTHRHVTTLGNLNRVALRSYAARGPLRRYADFFAETFLLPEESINAGNVQPRIYVPSETTRRYPALARAFGLNTDAILIACFFQSVVAAKCYERWDETMAMVSAHIDRRFPGKRVDFFVACGPDTMQPVHQEDLADIFGGFTGSRNNSRVIVATTPSLLDLAVILQHATLALSNDTGPGHLAGALGIPTVIPFLPGMVYSKQVWASTRWHRGVTLDPNPYSFEALKAEVFAGRTAIINTIPPEHLAAEAIRHLAAPDAALDTTVLAAL
jgi:Glycosyltransferase family 9 (heptosyltransferase)